MIRSVVYRNALSALLFALAIAGIVVQLRAIRSGIVFPQTRLVLAGYIIVALYAAASIVLRLRGPQNRR